MMKTKMMKRLRSHAGETIAEVLVALLISVLALTMLAAMISSTVSMVNKSKAKMMEYYDANKVLELQETSLTTTTITISGTDNATGNKVNESVTDVKLYENNELKEHVYAYRK